MTLEVSAGFTPCVGNYAHANTEAVPMREHSSNDVLPTSGVEVNETPRRWCTLEMYLVGVCMCVRTVSTAG